MSVFQESDIEFDFSAALSVVKHDSTNSVFPGVDFIVDEAANWLWVEVKNWEGSSIPASRRGGQRRSFLAKLNSKIFFKGELRAKFTGTLAHLALTTSSPTKAIVYVALPESPRMDSALMVHASDRLRNLVERKAVWHFPVNAAVINLSEWQARYPEFPAKAI